MLSFETKWPGLHQDGSFFSTVSLNIKHNNNHAFDVYNVGFLVSNGKSDFNFHGQLYHPIISWLMSKANYDNYLNVLQKINLLTFFVSFILFYNNAYKKILNIPMYAAYCGLAAASAINGLLQYLQGRPEHGIVVVSVFFLLILEILNYNSINNLLYGIFLGIITAISPMPGTLLSVLSVFSVSLKSDNTKTLAQIVFLRMFFCLATWTILMLCICPFSISELVNNTINTHKYIMNLFARLNPSILAFIPPINIDWFIESWFKRPLVPGIGYLFFFGLAIGVTIFISELHSSRPLIIKLFSVLCIILLIKQIWFIGFVWSPTNYSLLALFPILAIWITSNLDQFKKLVLNFSQKKYFMQFKLIKNNFSNKNLNYILPILYFFCLFFPALGYSKNCLMQTSIINYGITYEHALKKMNLLKYNLVNNEKILIDAYSNPQSAVIFDSPPWKTITYEGFMDGPLEKIEEKLNFRGKYIFYLQAGGEKPPERAGFKLIETNFNSKPVEFFGKTIRSTTPGYGYAIYERIEPHASDLIPFSR